MFKTNFFNQGSEERREMKQFSQTRTSKIDFTAATHVCVLAAPEDVVVTYINDGLFVNFRRRLKTFFMINEQSHYARQCYKSTHQVEKEKRRHLKSYYYMIHPLSKAKEYGDIALFVTLLLASLSSAVIIRDRLNQVFDLVIDAILFLDVVRVFFTGIYRDDFNDTLLVSKKVARIYLRSWFLNDIVTCFPVPILNLRNFSRNYFVYYASFLILVKLTRVLKFLRVVHEIQRHQQISVYLYNAIRLMFLVIAIMLWIGFAWLILNSINPERWFENCEMDSYLCVLLRNFDFFFLLSTNDMRSQNVISLIWEIGTMAAGFCFYIYASVQFFHFVKMYNMSAHMHELKKGQVSVYADFKHLPISLKNRMLRYFDCRFERTFFDVNVIENSVSRHLRRRIWHSQAENILAKTELLSTIRIDILSQIMKMMENRTFLANDNICKPSVKQKFLHVILTGSVALYSDTGIELCHLYERDCFGQGTRMQIFAFAIDNCSLLRISHTDLEIILKNEPGTMDAIIEAINKTTEECQIKRVSVQQHKSQQSKLRISALLRYHALNP